MRWVITRELHDARPLADELGLVVIPCIARVERPWPRLPERGLVFVTSAFVARHLSAMRVPHSTRIAALAPSTSALLAHVDVVAEGGAVALADAVKASGQGPFDDILYPTSDVGLEQPEQSEAVRILETLGPVRRAVVYATEAPFDLAVFLERYAGEGFVFYSPSAVRNFAEAKGRAGKVICVGASTARAWEVRGLTPAPLLATHETVKKLIEENP